MIYGTLGVLDNDTPNFELGRPCTTLWVYLLFIYQDVV